MEAAAILKFCFHSRNSAIFARICTKFCTVTQNHVPGTVMPSDLTSDKIQDGGGPIFKFCVNGHNLTAVPCICTKFDTDSKLGPGSSFAVKFTYYEIQNGGGGHFESHFNGYNSAVFAYISIKFDAVTENDVPQEVLKS